MPSAGDRLYPTVVLLIARARWPTTR